MSWLVAARTADGGHRLVYAPSSMRATPQVGCRRPPALVLGAIVVGALVAAGACAAPAPLRNPPLAASAPNPLPAPPASPPGQCTALDQMRIVLPHRMPGGSSTTWVLHEHLDPDPKVDPWPSVSETRLAAEVARARGATSTDAPVWVLVAGEAPCRMAVGEFLEEWMDSYPRFERVTRELQGACSPAAAHGDSPAIAFQQVEEPSRCRLVGVKVLPDAKIPSGIVPAKACEPPACDYRTRFEGSGLPGGGLVLAITATWVYPTDENECAWKHEDFFGVYAQASSRLPFVPIPAADALWGALVDDGGLRAVLRNEDHTLAVVPFDGLGKPGAVVKSISLVSVA